MRRKANEINHLENMERVKGIEPSYEAWEAAVLPLNYTRLSRRTGDRPCAGLARMTSLRKLQSIGQCGL